MPAPRKDRKEIERVAKAVIIERAGDVLAEADREVIGRQNKTAAHELAQKRPHVPARVEERRVVLADAVGLPDEAFSAHKKAGKAAGHGHQKKQGKERGRSRKPAARYPSSGRISFFMSQFA